ncbi:MAG TPA: 2OG-Fe dioxygenase family protein [Steroidobacter sp.]|nr:2OG-Fe dioxygenase family protein [Steroidobacter sp.]
MKAHQPVTLQTHGDAVGLLRQSGFALLDAAQFAMQHGLEAPMLDRLRASWDGLPRDTWLRDGGRYRFRRHSCFIYTPTEDLLELQPHRAHWQPKDYNALHGGIERWFEPIEAHVLAHPVWSAVLRGLGRQLAQLRSVEHWCIEAHQFRIDASEGIGRPTPEGAHRDGVDFVAVILVQRRDVRGGETRVFEADGLSGVRFTMTEPWSALLLDDARIIHETTPIRPNGPNPVRDTLVLTYREHGFQSPHSEIPACPTRVANSK